MSLDEPAIPQRALDSLPVNVAIVDSEGTIVWTNSAWREFAENNDAETFTYFVGTSYLDVSGDEYANDAVTGLREILDGEREEFRMEYPCHSPEQKRWFLMWAAPLTFEGDRYVIVAHFDVTDRVLVEQEIAEYAEETSKQRDHLVLLNQLVRHDIRNDIQLVMTHAELLRDAVEPDQQEHVENVLEQANHIVELTEAVRELEAAITGEEEPDLSPVHLGAVLQSEADKVRSTHSTVDREVVVTGTDDLDYGTTVWANELLSSVFGNLLSNAVIHNDTEQPRVDITVERTDETVLVEIADNGPGIPEDDWDRVFGRGEIGEENPGTGLGLYLVDRLVDLYGGSVWISENEPRGAVFHVELERAGQP